MGVAYEMSKCADILKDGVARAEARALLHPSRNDAVRISNRHRHLEAGAAKRRKSE